MVKTRRKRIPIKAEKQSKSYDRLAKRMAPIIKRMLNNPKFVFTRALGFRASRQQQDNF